eukprot:CAMPEP_0174369734 /NCGR_PEP_ID=MMETSP0811_2-20130205/93562_1 /TAXON_ID=73025 ORGANISM="Eutreptiella gymnastica-like, Strain CCMP1594" /NCGR_SAMPLE_ID=MMETSP0811_2 /ASSEMBLY_ACC=CAM_ASM_000667 /LENGTH=156 /DNA_ID=CAMNT_0015514483 /DNA_START=193 /DNA_END=663 /DNA_ORIENTATION=+
MKRQIALGLFLNDPFGQVGMKVEDASQSLLASSRATPLRTFFPNSRSCPQRPHRGCDAVHLVGTTFGVFEDVRIGLPPLLPRPNLLVGQALPSADPQGIGNDFGNSAKDLNNPGVLPKHVFNGESHLCAAQCKGLFSGGCIPRQNLPLEFNKLCCA